MCVLVTTLSELVFNILMLHYYFSIGPNFIAKYS